MGQVKNLPIEKQDKGQRTDTKPRKLTNSKMTKDARKRKTRRKNKSTIRLATLTSFNNIVQEINEELINKNRNFCNSRNKGERLIPKGI